MATQFTNKSTSNVTVNGTEFVFESNPVTAELFNTSSVTLVKSQTLGLVVVGDTLGYTIVITNLSLQPLSNFKFEDIIPTGLTYKTGSFKVNLGTQTPTISGQNLSYDFTTLPIGVTTVAFDCDVV